MTGGVSDDSLLDVSQKHPFSTHQTLIIGGFTLIPIIALGVLGKVFTARFRPIDPLYWTNFDWLRHALSTHYTVLRADSWYPMWSALDTLRGPNRDRLYETVFFRDHIRFQYPPSSLLGMDLLQHAGHAGLGTLNTINLVVFLLNVVAIAFLAWRLFSRAAPAARPGVVSGEPAPNPIGMAAVAAGGALLFVPVVSGLYRGQIQVGIDLLFTGAVIFWAVERRLLAGVLIGVACTIKPQLGLFLVWGVLWRERRFVVGLIVGLAPLLVLSLLRYGLHNHFAYLSALSYLSHHGESYYANASINGILNWYSTNDDYLVWHEGKFPPYIPSIYYCTLVVSLIFLAILALPGILQQKRRAELSDLGVAAICTVVSSPIAWEHHYGLLLPLFIVALSEGLKTRGVERWVTFVALVLSWTLVADYIPFTYLLAHTAFAFTQAYQFFGAVMLLGLLLTTCAPRAAAVETSRRPETSPSAARGTQA